MIRRVCRALHIHLKKNQLSVREMMKTAGQPISFGEAAAAVDRLLFIAPSCFLHSLLCKGFRMNNTWHLIDSGEQSGAYNMALDEKLLDHANKEPSSPILRFYQWQPPAVSLGRFQNIATAINQDACRRHGIDVVRRITGGRAVLHHHEVTYSIIARTDNPLFPSSVLGTYKVIARCLLAGLANLGISAEMVSHRGRYARLVGQNRKSSACFSSPSWYEIVVKGKKIIGSAQRRLSHAFLQHGSLLIEYDPVLENEVIPGTPCESGVTSVKQECSQDVTSHQVIRALVAGFSEVLGIQWSSEAGVYNTQK
ncbi:MAG: lipoate--protein ligase family protein [Nitrospirota bacterium]